MDYRKCPKFIEAERYLDEKQNPIEYMISILEKLKAAQHGRGENPFIFTLANAESIFHMLDPNMRGYVTFEQYKHGLETLGITEFDIMPRGIGKNTITKEVFLAAAQKGLDHLSSTYQHIPGFPSSHVEKDQREETKLDQNTC
ncbi:EF-hand calcium-binding domain-containing protein 10 [Echinococcus granulosus]|uniref:EF hand 2 domain containing protein n=1 Tax=Echinococcus granulosus TaxID=6210 RepID=A0A068W9Q8_ECHGR|nr:EF-hand calcium-binding domain-containing protein 10 [Echinococcus granulosus]CDS16390.1 EF hand 2 domain containing protein [Echinococcus granulosus]